MNKILATVSLFMAALMSFFSPLTVNHGNQGCCAECALKKEDEVEFVYEDEENKNIDE